MGPVLRNVMRLKFPNELKIAGFADDGLLEVYGESNRGVELQQTGAGPPQERSSGY